MAILLWKQVPFVKIIIVERRDTMYDTYVIQPLQLAENTFSFLDKLPFCIHPIFVEINKGNKKAIKNKLIIQNYLIWYFMLHPKERLTFYIHKEDIVQFNDLIKEDRLA